METKNTNFQQCAQLKVDDNYNELRANGLDPLEMIFNTQKKIQEDTYGYNFDEVRSTIGKLKAFIDWNEEAIRDEDRELQSALTGIHTYPNCWKPWKTKHKEAMARSLSDLTEDELKELQMEFLDKYIFMTNIQIALNITPEILTNYFVSKSSHNIERQQRPEY